MKYSNYSFKINALRENQGFTWIFLPGGPGLGSEYLEPLAKNLNLPGSTLLVDFPKDGTNKEGLLNFTYWKKGLIDLVAACNEPILVGHSFSAMFVLDTPEIEPYLKGLVLMNTTTKNSFFEHVSTMQKLYNLPDLIPSAAEYHLAPSNETYKNFWDVYKYYCFTQEELPLGEKMMELLAFNNEPYHYAIQHFFPNYHSTWQPKIPTLTIAGENDFICPPTVFTEDIAFQRDNILNQVIPKAGHCSWLLYMDEVRECFKQFTENTIKGIP